MTPAQWAETAAEAVRGLNRATVGGYRWPSDVDRVVAELEILAQRLPQALEQAARWLLVEHRAGRVGLDASARLSDRVHSAEFFGGVFHRLVLAQASAERLGYQLGELHALTAHLTGEPGTTNDNDDGEVRS